MSDHAARGPVPVCLTPPPVFTIGGEFEISGRRWRCTDIGTRVITAICLDNVELGGDVSADQRALSRAEAEQAGWFSGPPYAVLEVVFDEYDQPGCTLVEPEANTPTG